MEERFDKEFGKRLQSLGYARDVFPLKQFIRSYGDERERKAYESAKEMVDELKEITPEDISDLTNRVAYHYALNQMSSKLFTKLTELS